MSTKELRLKLLFKNSFIVFFHTTLSLMMIDWAMPIKYSIGPFGFYEISLILLSISFLGCMYFEKGVFLKRLPELFKASSVLFILLALYICFGVVTLFYAKDFSFALLKYITVLQMIVFGFYSLYYVFFDDDSQRSLRHFKQVTLNLGLTSLFIALFAFAGYFTETYTAFYQRISTIIDYNQYSTILLVGMVCLEIWLIRSNLKFFVKYGSIVLSSFILSSASFASGSRRSAVLLCVIGVVLFVYAIFHETKVFLRDKNKLNMFLAVVLSLVALIGSASFSKYTQNTVGIIGQDRYNKVIEYIQSLPEGSIGDGETENLLYLGTQNEISETIEGIFNGNGMAGREAIWELAFDRIEEFDTKGLLFGGGASYSWDIYDDWESEDMSVLKDRYYKFVGFDNWMNPHNLFLQDMLDGGIILLLLQVLLVGCILIYIFKGFATSANNSAVLLLMSLIIFVTLFLSCGKGMITHKYFWLILIGLFANRYILRIKPKDNQGE